ncbi:MAG: biopolymer transporter Tol, partial [Candidatus Neomarinimicrobiota bacterium]
NISFAQSFGKNKVQYDDFKWSYIQTKHFDIYFYEGGKDLAIFAAPIAEEQIKRITSILNWRMRKRTSLIIYNSHSDFQQTNVVLDYLTEGTGGFTELFKNRAVVPFDGNYHEFWHVIRHELLHVVINDMIYGGNIQSIISGRVKLRIPLWMNEGFAEYISMGWDTHADLIMRDVALNNDIPDIKNLDYYMAYKGGQSVYRYVADKYGVEKIGEIWSQMKSRGDFEKGFKSAIGMGTKDLTKKWQRWLRNL